MAIELFPEPGRPIKQVNPYIFNNAVNGWSFKCDPTASLSQRNFGMSNLISSFFLIVILILLQSENNLVCYNIYIMTKKSVNTNKNTIKIIINNDSKKRKRKSKKQLAKSKFRTPLGTPSQPAGQNVVSSSGNIVRVPKGVSVGSTGLLDDYSTLAREYNNPAKVLPKDVETPSTTVSKSVPTLVKQLRDATTSEKADLMALSLPHLRTAIKSHHPSISNSELRSINKSNKENYIDNLFGFPPSRPVAGEARKRFSDIDSDDDQLLTDDVPVRGAFKTPKFQGQRPPSASVDFFESGVGVSGGSGFLQPEDNDRLQQQNFDNLPQDTKDILNPPDDDDAHAPIPPPPPPPPQANPKVKKEKKEKKQDEGLHANITLRAEQKHDDPFDIHLTDAPKSNRRDSFLDDRPVSGGGGFSDQKALSAPSKTPRTPPTFRLGKGTFNPNADEESIIFGPSAVKQSPQALSRKAIDEAREEVRHQSDLHSQLMGKPTAPARRVSIKVPVDTSKAAIAGSGLAIPTRRGVGRPKSDGN